MMDHAKRGGFARFMATSTLVLMVLAPAVTASIWIFLDVLPPDTFMRLGPAFDPQEIGVGARLIGFLVMMVPTAIGLYGLAHLRRTFVESAAGHSFSKASVDGFRRFAWAVLFYVISVPVMKAALSVVLSFHNPPGQRVLAIELSSNDVIGLFLAGLLVAVGHIFAEARALAEENASFV